MDNKKILLVSNMYPSKKYPHYGVFVKNTADLLKTIGYKIDKVIIKKENSKFKKLFSYLSFYLSSFFKCVCFKYDYIYIHFASLSSLGCYYAKKINKNLNIVVNLHGNDLIPDDLQDKKRLKYTEKILPLASKILVPSDYFKNYLLNLNLKINAEIFVYPSSGVDTNLFKKIDKSVALESLDLSSDYKYIGYVSRIEKDKGWDFYLKLLNLLSNKNPLIKGIIVGDGNEIESFNKMLKELKLEDKIIKYPLLSQRQLVSVYNVLDVYCFPTHRKSESLGLVGLEAMACESLVVATNNYGPSTYIVNNVNGFSFEPNNLNDFLFKVETALTSQDKQIRFNARETAKQYDKKVLLPLLRNIFDDFN